MSHRLFRALKGAAAALLASCAVANAEAPAGITVDYTVDGAPFQGYYAAAVGDSKGLVLIVHDWDGLTQYERTRADMLAQLGYAAFAVDIYGAGVRPETFAEKRALAGQMYADRPAMRARLAAALEAARSVYDSDAPTVAMGYCFGGTAALELARANPEGVAGYASFHGGLQTPEGQSYDGVAAPIRIYHGGGDQAVPMTDVAQLSVELEASGTPYEIEVYSGAPHAFTVFGSNRYRARADAQSWAAFTDFLEEATAQ